MCRHSEDVADLSKSILLLTFTFPASARRPVRPSCFERHLVIEMCPFVDRLITSKDHASVQIAIVDVDANGKALGTTTTFALCGQVRASGESDDSINRLATKAGRALSFISFSVPISDTCLFSQSFVTSGPTRSNDSPSLDRRRCILYLFRFIQVLRTRSNNSFEHPIQNWAHN